MEDRDTHNLRKSRDLWKKEGDRRSCATAETRGKLGINMHVCNCKEDQRRIAHFLYNFVQMIRILCWKQQRELSPTVITLILSLLTLGCPQRIAKRGCYGAFLMDNLPLIKSLVENLASNLNVPVPCKIRIFPKLQDTINYAKMLEEAGCSLLAVHGRTRDEKEQKKVRTDLNAIKAVKDSLKIPVLANGNIRHMDDVYFCLEETGADGVLSAESLLVKPALFAGFRTAQWVSNCWENNKESELDQADLLIEYLHLCEKYSVPWRIIRSHVHKLLGELFRANPEVREELNAKSILTFEFLYGMIDTKMEGEFS